MESNHHLHHHQPSRPPSVDSVNLGSVYSGFYPQATSTGPSSLTNIPISSYQPPSHQQMLPQYSQQQYHSIPNYAIGVGNGSMVPQAYQTYNQTVQMQSPPQQPQSLPLNLTYHYQISASAAAAAAFGFNLQQQKPSGNTSGVSTVSSLIQSPPKPAIGMAQSSTVQWPTPPPLLNNNMGQFGAMTNQNNSLSNDYVSQYYSQYYREYYQRIVAYHKLQQQVQNQKKIAPYKYNQFHTPIIFSKHDNQLLVVEPNARIGIYGLQEVFTEQCYPQLFLQSLLYDNNDDHNSTLLPFADSQAAIDWIRVKQLNDSTMNYELKLILKVITMLFRQNGSVSGLDLSELLFELVTVPNDDSEKLSQSGSEAITKDYYKDLLSHLRQLLMRGQRRVAITFAQNNGLFDHALALSFLLSFLSNNIVGGNTGQLVDNGLMISTIRKFISTTLSPDDPLYVFYSHLLQIATNIVNTASDSGVLPASSTSSAKIDKLESFIILLANDIKFDKVEISDKSYKNLIDLMIALLKEDHTYILPDELFNNDRFDCLLVNECLEYARFHGQKLNPKLILRKLEFSFELFDFGFVRHARNYLTIIKNSIQDPEFDWKLVMDKKSKYCKFLILDSVINNIEDGKQNYKLLQDIWLYQIMKIFNRKNSVENFDSPLFTRIQAKQDSKMVGDEEVDAEDDNDKTDLVDELEDEEVDVELETSESSISKQEPSLISSPIQQQSVEDKSNISLNKSAQYSQINSTIVSNNSATPLMDKLTLNTTELSPIESLQHNTDNQSSNENIPVSMPILQQQTQGRHSLPTIPNHNLLNPIMEISSDSLQKVDSIDSAPLSSDNDAFKMNSLQSSLSTLNNPMNLEYADNSVSQPKFSSPILFQPLPLPPTSDSGAFDFVSTNGRVSSIPSYDPIVNDDQPGDNSPSYNTKNNEFLQNYNSNNTSMNKVLADNKKESSNGGESAKTSPVKSNNNGGLLNAIFGRLKPKNQMILPDDKDPQIIYDPVSKKWIDKSANDQNGLGAGGPPPPPKIPFGGNNAAGFRSEPNSTLTSPMTNPLPSLPTFGTLNSLTPKNDEKNQSPTSNQPMMANGGLTLNNVSFAPPTGNVFRNDIRRKRYIDVFNQPSSSMQQQ